jgi:hypothetical protein
VKEGEHLKEGLGKVIIFLTPYTIDSLGILCFCSLHVSEESTSGQCGGAEPAQEPLSMLLGKRAMEEAVG